MGLNMPSLHTNLIDHHYGVVASLAKVCAETWATPCCCGKSDLKHAIHLPDSMRYNIWDYTLTRTTYSGTVSHNSSFDTRGVHDGGHLLGDVFHVPVTFGIQRNLVLKAHVCLPYWYRGIFIRTELVAS